MKIRQIEDHAITRKVAHFMPCSPDQQAFWYDEHPTLKARSCYFDHEWEEVPDEPELVDVTSQFHEGEAECWVNHRQVIQGCGQDVVLGEGCEWRKIEAYVIPKEYYVPGNWEQYKQTVLQVWGPKS